MSVFTKMAEKIIKEQENIIGPLAIEQAQKVSGLTVNWSKGEVKLEGDEKEIINNLIEKYKEFFGQASVEVCKDAVKDIVNDLTKDQLPTLLRT